MTQEKVLRPKTLPQRINKVRDLIRSAGTTIGAVHFEKRRGGGLRKMAYRLHVRNPSIAAKPRGLDDDGQPRRRGRYYTDLKNLQMTVLDVNKVIRDKDGNIVGRGAWRTIPLELVRRIAVKGKAYTIKW